MWLSAPTKPPKTLLFAGRPGLGHIMRCLALSRYLERPALLVPEPHPILKTAPCPVGLWDDPPDCELAVVDSYEPVQWPRCTTRAIITDGGDYPVFGIDYLIDPNVGADPANYHTRACVMAGPRFALLRPQFAERRKFLHNTTTSRKVARLLVCLGGGCAAMSRIEELAQAVRTAVAGQDIALYVYGGTADPLPQFGPHVRVGNGFYGRAIDAMAGADLAITPASTTALELLCLGVPTLTYWVAENQTLCQARMIQARVTHPFSMANLLVLMVDANERAKLSETGMRLVDGKGAERVGAILNPRKSASR